MQQSIEVTDQQLEKIHAHKPDIHIYRLSGPNGTKLVRYLVSTPETRTICNQPEIFGMDFTKKLHTAVRKTLEVLPEAEQFKKLPDYETNVVSILRGGLNFRIREALAEAYGYNKHSTTYLISQRQKDEHGKWHADVQTYKKITIPKTVTFFLGDVIGTGTSLREALIALDKLMDVVNVRTVRKFVVMTFGCYRAEKVLEAYDVELRKRFPDYEETIVIYFEGKFKLAAQDMAIRLIEPGTDFLRKECILTPEFALSQYEQNYYPLERCTIYDAGSRAFDILLYKKELQEYWAKMLQEANNGYTLYDALQERFPDVYPTQDIFLKEKRMQWKGVTDGFLQQFWLKHQERWTAQFIDYAKSPDALKKMCILRLEMIQNHEC